MCVCFRTHIINAVIIKHLWELVFGEYLKCKKTQHLCMFYVLIYNSGLLLVESECAFVIFLNMYRILYAYLCLAMAFQQVNDIHLDNLTINNNKF